MFPTPTSRSTTTSTRPSSTRRTRFASARWWSRIRPRPTRLRPRRRPCPRPAPPDQKQFKDIVAKYSDDDDAKQRAGDLGFFDKESTRYPKPVVEAAFKLAEVGDVAAPIKTEKGYSVIRLAQKRPGFNRPLAEVKRQIQQRLFRDTRTKAMDNFVAELKKKSAIEVNDANLAKVVIDTGTGAAPTAGGPPGAPPGMSFGPPGAGAMQPPPGTPAMRPAPIGKP